MLVSSLKCLLAWYEESKRPLPWRLNRDPYSVMVSEFMCQQTTVAAATPKYLAWKQSFPSVETLASADLDSVLAHWSGLGYYQRARRLHRAAQDIVELGYFPDTVKELQKLPGFGPYTAAAVASICFERPTLAIDTNVIRVLYRYYAFDGEAQDKKLHQNLREKTRPSMALCNSGDLNQALMELGATICSNKRPACGECPLAVSCLGRKNPKGATAYPRTAKKQAPRLTPGTVVMLETPSAGNLLFVRGTSLGLLKDLFQPPIIFRNEGHEHPIDRVVRPFVLQAAESRELQIPELNYSISGRKLELKILHVSLEKKNWAKLKKSLHENKIHSALWSLERAESLKAQLPISTLTRKVLEKDLENRRVVQR